MATLRRSYRKYGFSAIAFIRIMGADSVLRPDLQTIRTEYARAGLEERDLDPSPIRQIDRWLADAIAAEHPEPTAMTLATASRAGEPAARVVLLKRIDDRGLV